MRNKTRKFTLLSTFFAFALLCGMMSSCSKSATPEVVVKEANVVDTVEVLSIKHHVTGSAIVEAQFEIVHPKFENLDEKEFGVDFFGDIVRKTTFLVVKRDNKILTVIGNRINRERLEVSPEYLILLTDKDKNEKRLINVKYYYLIPNEYRNDEIHLMISKEGDFDYKEKIEGDSNSYEFIAPDDIWFDFTDFKRK